MKIKFLFLCLLLACSLVAPVLSVQAQEKEKPAWGKTYGLFIALDQYRHWPSRAKAVHRIKEIKETLQKKYEIEAIYTIFDNQATQINILKKLRELAFKLKKYDNLLLIFSGHGQEKGGEYYFLPYESRQAEAEKSWLSYSTVFSYLEKNFSGKLLVMSDDGFRGKSQNNKESSRIVEFRILSALTEDISDSQAFWEQVAWVLEGNELSHFGVEAFTEEVIRGIKGIKISNLRPASNENNNLELKLKTHKPELLGGALAIPEVSKILDKNDTAPQNSLAIEQVQKQELMHEDKPVDSGAQFTGPIDINLFFYSGNVMLSFYKDSGEVSFVPPSALNIGLSFLLGDFGFSFSSKYKDIDEHEEKIAGSNTDVQLFFYQKGWGLDFIYQAYEGFYLDDNGYTLVNRPDLKLNSFGINYYYVFGEDYNFKSFLYPEFVDKNEFGAMGLLSIKSSAFEADYELIPLAAQAEFSDAAGLFAGNYVSVSLGFGIGSNIEGKHWAFNNVVMLALGISSITEESVATETNEYTDGVLKFIWKFNVAYKFETFYMGMLAMVDAESYGSFNKEEGVSRNLLSMNVKFYTGFRF